MVEFITLFLGALVVGPQPVDLLVHRNVAALEVRLDGEAVSTLREPPWRLEVDFGGELEPHFLEAVGYGAEGQEVGRAGQWVNLSPRQSEITLVLDRDHVTGRAEVRLGWQSLSEENEPIDAVVVFDGKTLRVDDPRIISLPPHDPESLHHLRVDLEFPGGLRSSADLTFGGRYGDRVSSELTPFAISLDKRRKPPAVEEMGGWFQARGRSLAVHTVEEGPAEIVVVRSPEARRRLVEGLRPGVGPRLPILAKDHSLRFVGSRPALLARSEGPFVIFPRSQEITTRIQGLRRTLATVNLPGGALPEVRLADAVAVAGLFANQGGRRRAVVLITTGESADESQYSPERVRSYLAAVGVPLVVWNPEVGEKEAGPWGEARNISTDSLLDQAYRELSRILERQRIVWLNGLHLPQDVEIASGVEGLRPQR